MSVGPWQEPHDVPQASQLLLPTRLAHSVPFTVGVQVPVSSGVQTDEPTLHVPHWPAAEQDCVPVQPSGVSQALVEVGQQTALLPAMQLPHEVPQASQVLMPVKAEQEFPSKEGIQDSVVPVVQVEAFFTQVPQAPAEQDCVPEQLSAVVQFLVVPFTHGHPACEVASQPLLVLLSQSTKPGAHPHIPLEQLAFAPQFFAVPEQVPPEHASFTVQALPSLQAVPFAMLPQLVPLAQDWHWLEGFTAPLA
jgi:hypothetical protein